MNRKDNLVSYCKKFSLVLSELLAHEGLDVVFEEEKKKKKLMKE